MIQIKLHQEVWKVFISDEEWEFKTKKELTDAVNKLIEFKDKNGRIKQNG